MVPQVPQPLPGAHCSLGLGPAGLEPSRIPGRRGPSCHCWPVLSPNRLYLQLLVLNMHCAPCTRAGIAYIAASAPVTWLVGGRHPAWDPAATTPLASASPSPKEACPRDWMSVGPKASPPQRSWQSGKASFSCEATAWQGPVDTDFENNAPTFSPCCPLAGILYTAHIYFQIVSRHRECRPGGSAGQPPRLQTPGSAPAP